MGFDKFLVDDRILLGEVVEHLELPSNIDYYLFHFRGILFYSVDLSEITRVVKASVLSFESYLIQQIGQSVCSQTENLVLDADKLPFFRNLRENDTALRIDSYTYG